MLALLDHGGALEAEAVHASAGVLPLSRNMRFDCTSGPAHDAAGAPGRDGIDPCLGLDVGTRRFAGGAVSERPHHQWQYSVGSSHFATP